MSKKGIAFKSFDHRAVFENLETGNCILAVQGKDNQGRDLKVLDKSQLPDLGTPNEVIAIEAIFGIYDLLSGSFAAVVVESESYVSVNAIVMRKAKKIQLLPLFGVRKVLSETKQKDEDRYLQLLHMAFTSHTFFYSFTYDVTLTQQALASLSAQQQQRPLWARADHRFFWNREVVVDLIAIEADQWIVPFMSAYVEVRPECEVDDEKFTLLFISRRSRYRQGCRFTKRGLDDQGNPANFVETEQVLLFPSGKITSFVQIRGSIPVKWSSPVLMKYDPIVYIDEDRPKSIELAKAHITELCEKYCDEIGKSSVIFINLVDNKKDQGKLGAAFKEIVDAVTTHLGQIPLTYVWFDFHHETKQKGKWNNLSKLVKQVEEKFKAQKYFCKQANGAVTSMQAGVIRTNCMDNLDRTNVVQSLFARRSLVMQLGKEQLAGTSVLDTPWQAFEKVYKTVWANNADAISMGYAGTGALKVDFTKTGKRTYKGMFNDGVNSCIRYYLNNFTDGTKQDSIDLLLGNFKPDATAPSPFKELPNQETLVDNGIKVFVLMVSVFSGLLLITPHVPSSNFSYLTATNTLTGQLVISIAFTSLVVLYLLYLVMKKGSTIGERIVVHPQLVREPVRKLGNK